MIHPLRINGGDRQGAAAPADPSRDNAAQCAANQWVPCVKLPGQRLTARDFNRQVTELRVRIAALNGDTALGIPVTEAVG
tara:strand:+ start:119 stop:358 length:240 start_codon:yes stop_codon:yes gene_type:complete